MKDTRTTTVVTGVRRLDRQLSRLSARVGKRINAAAVRSGLRVIAKAIRAESPSRNLRRAIGFRFGKKKRDGQYEALAGMNVGKRRVSRRAKSGKLLKANAAPHGHLVTLGTTDRYTKTGAYRGVMPANDFVDRGFRRSQAAAKQVIRRRFAELIKRELAKGKS